LRLSLTKETNIIFVPHNQDFKLNKCYWIWNSNWYLFNIRLLV